MQDNYMEGIGEATSAVAGIAGAILGGKSDSDTLEMQERMTREGWDRSAAEGQKSRTYNRLEAKKVRDYQAVMSNSAYQRRTTDMRKAGINPMLAIMKGGADTPAGAAASSSAAGISGASKLSPVKYSEHWQRASAQSADMMRARKDVKVGTSQKNLNLQATALKKKEIQLVSHTAQKAKQEATQAELQTRIKKLETEKRSWQLKKDLKPARRKTDYWFHKAGEMILKPFK